MLWISNAILDFFITVFAIFLKNQSDYNLFTRMLISVLNIILVILMFHTKERTIERPRPGMLETPEGKLIEELENG